MLKLSDLVIVTLNEDVLTTDGKVRHSICNFTEVLKNRGLGTQIEKELYNKIERDHEYDAYNTANAVMVFNNTKYNNIVKDIIISNGIDYNDLLLVLKNIHSKKDSFVNEYFYKKNNTAGKMLLRGLLRRTAKKFSNNTRTNNTGYAEYVKFKCFAKYLRHCNIVDMVYEDGKPYYFGYNIIETLATILSSEADADNTNDRYVKINKYNEDVKRVYKRDYYFDGLYIIDRLIDEYVMLIIEYSLARYFNISDIDIVINDLGSNIYD